MGIIRVISKAKKLLVTFTCPECKRHNERWIGTEGTSIIATCLFCEAILELSQKEKFENEKPTGEIE